MFESLSNRLGDVFGKLKRRGVLNEDDVNAAMREVRIALLEADVSLSVVKEFIASLKEKAVGQEVIRSVSPAQMVIKLVQDHLTELLGKEAEQINLNAEPPVTVMMVGLQGSGKTTSSAKIALRLKDKHRKKVLMASLDVQRPAAQEQLEVLGKQAEIDTLPIVKGETPEKITERAMEKARLEGYDVLLLDTAGRLHVDESLMDELKRVQGLCKPTECLLVADSLTGQDAVNVAGRFEEEIFISGIVLTRMDGDGRGGAALSMRSVTGCPIKYIGVGEKLTELEEFHPDRIASRILDMGDVVALVERASEAIDKEEAEDMAKRLQRGHFDLNDLSSQLNNMRKMGGVSSMMGMLPGMGKVKKQLEGVDIDDKVFVHQQAIISSMTPEERKNPKVINGSRKRRIASGAGMTVQDVNRLLKQHRQMSDMVRKLSRGGVKGLMRSMQQMVDG